MAPCVDEYLTPSPRSLVEKVPLVFEQPISGVEAKDKFRVEFLRRLSDEKVWIPKEKRAPDHQTLIIFDWDDTLFYTSYLHHKRNYRNDAAIQQQLQSIEKSAYDILDLALGLGQTFIITNAQEGWVEECVDKYMPSLRGMIQKLPIISARSNHERESAHLSEWKNRAFCELGKQLDSQTITNLVAVGDSNFEMEAVHLLGQQFSRSLIKTVKLRECPSPEELMKELVLIGSKFQTIVERAANMKIRLERK